MADVPILYRTILQVSDIEAGAAFYARLLGFPGERVAPSRHYFNCGPVILALVDPTQGGEPAKPNPDHTYFSVTDLDAIHARTSGLGALSQEEVHGEPAGAIVTRPWGERSFYAIDPFGSRLCFVDAATLFTGH